MFDWENPSPERPNEFRGYEAKTCPPEGWLLFQQNFTLPTLEQIRDRTAPQREGHVAATAPNAHCVHDPGDALPDEYQDVIANSFWRLAAYSSSEVAPGTAPRSVRPFAQAFDPEDGWVLEYRTPSPVPTPGRGYTCTRDFPSILKPTTDRLPDLARFILRCPDDHPHKTCARRLQARQFEM